MFDPLLSLPYILHHTTNDLPTKVDGWWIWHETKPVSKGKTSGQTNLLLDTWSSGRWLYAIFNICKCEWGAVIPLDCKQGKRYTHKILAIKPAPPRLKTMHKAQSGMLHTLDGECTFHISLKLPFCGTPFSQVCCSYNPDAFHCAKGYVPIKR